MWRVPTSGAIDGVLQRRLILNEVAERALGLPIQKVAVGRAQLLRQPHPRSALAIKLAAKTQRGTDDARRAGSTIRMPTAASARQEFPQSLTGTVSAERTRAL